MQNPLTSPQETYFDKRIYRPRTLIADLKEMIAHMDDLRAAARADRVDRAFAERIMLAVTEVNGCRYCSYAHTRVALQAGVTEDELQSLKVGDFDSLPDEQRVALLFAQHYAEQGGNPDPETRQRLVATYGEKTARDILAYIRMITIGNLLGNTFDAILSRFAGRPAEDSSLLSEVAVLLLVVLSVPLGLVIALGSRLKRLIGGK
jgi:AhpD family alkylhydroperoxidase